jgi:hypothetical protein
MIHMLVRLHFKKSSHLLSTVILVVTPSVSVVYFHVPLKLRKVLNVWIKKDALMVIREEFCSVSEILVFISGWSLQKSPSACTSPNIYSYSDLKTHTTSALFSGCSECSQSFYWIIYEMFLVWSFSLCNKLACFVTSIVQTLLRLKVNYIIVLWNGFFLECYVL